MKISPLKVDVSFKKQIFLLLLNISHYAMDVLVVKVIMKKFLKIIFPHELSDYINKLRLKKLIG